MEDSSRNSAAAMPQKDIDLKRINYLCFGGGGIRGVAFAGALSEMVALTRFDLGSLKGACGTSIGALYAAAVVIGKSAPFIEHMARTTSLMDFVSPDVTKLFLNWGFDTQTKLVEWIDEHFGRRHLTFRQLYEETGKVLRVTATDLHACDCYIIDHESEPNMPIARGIAMSMTLPPLFAPVEHRGRMYVDGGIFHNYPVDLFPAEETLGFKVLWGHCSNLNGFEKYFGRLTYAVLASSERSIWRSLSDTHRQHTVPIDCGDVSTINFRMSEEGTNAIIERGRAHVREFVHAHNIHALDAKVPTPESNQTTRPQQQQSR